MQALDTPDAFSEAKRLYPIFAKQDIAYAYQPKDVKPAGGLEVYSPGEEDRPAGMPISKPGIAIFDPKVTPKDVLGDWASHLGRFSDPTVKAHYDAFARSMSPQQMRQLVQQYQYAQKNEGEARPFESWAQTSGIPAWYRGALFDQWPKEFVDKFYTPEQLQQLRKIKPYLGLPHD